MTKFDLDLRISTMYPYIKNDCAHEKRCLSQNLHILTFLQKLIDNVCNCCRDKERKLNDHGTGNTISVCPWPFHGGGGGHTKPNVQNFRA
jgi:hypothetical protein